MMKRWTKESDLQKSINHTMDSCKNGIFGLDIEQEREYLMSRNDGKDFWELFGEHVVASETFFGRVKLSFAQIDMCQIKADLLTFVSVLPHWIIFAGKVATAIIAILILIGMVF